MTVEQQYVQELVRAWARGSTESVPLPAGAEAAVVATLLSEHQVSAVLAPLVPAPAFGEDHAKGAQSARARSEALLLELERIWPVLAGAADETVVLKGAALALGTYEHPTDRWFLDLDVLVPRPAVVEVCAGLAAAGYRPVQGRRDPLFYEKYHLHRILIGPQGALVEVHWALTLPHSVYRHGVAEVRQRAETFVLGRQQIRCAAPVDLILHGVYQNIADGFVDLRRVLDFVVLARRMQKADWELLVAVARAGGTQRALYASLYMVKSVSQIPIPQFVMDELDPGWLTRRTLIGLNFGAACLGRTAAHWSGYAQMMHLLLTPSVGLGLKEAGRWLSIGEERLLDSGHAPNEPISFAERSKMTLRSLFDLGRSLFYLSKALVSG